MADKSYTTSGNIRRTDGTVVNTADGLLPDGTQKVSVERQANALGMDVQYSSITSEFLPIVIGAGPPAAPARQWVGDNDWTAYSKVTLLGANSMNVPVRIYFNRPDIGDYSDAAGQPYFIEFPANQPAVLITPDDHKLLRHIIGEMFVLGLSAVGAPSGGGFSLYGFFTPII